MRLAICDDDPMFCEELYNYLTDFFPYHDIINPEIMIFHSGEEIVAYEEPLDIVFIDIEMAGLSGIHAAKDMQKRNPKMLYIVITAYAEYLDEAMHFKAFRYLSKPLDKFRLYRNLQDALMTFPSCNQKIIIEAKDITFSVYPDDIIMVETKSRSTYIHTINGTFPAKRNMNYWVSVLTSSCFFRTHRSYIINMNFVNAFRNNTVYLCENKYQAYLTVRRFPEFKQLYMVYLERSH